MKSFLFVDLTAEKSFNRFSSQVIPLLRSRGHRVAIHCLPQKIIPINFKFFVNLTKTLNELKKVISEFDVICIHGYRFWDIYILALSKSLGKQVCYIQYGLYSENISRFNVSLLSDIATSLSQVFTMICIMFLLLRFSLLYKLYWIRFYCFDLLFQDLLSQQLLIRPFLWAHSDYLHFDFLKFSGLSRSYFSYPDISVQKLDKSKQYKIVLICQTYVEDHRL